MCWARIVLLILGVVVMRPADAQETEEQGRASARFELTPFVGYRAGGDFDLEASGQEAKVKDHPSFALALGYRDEEFTYEIFYSRQPTEIESGDSFGASDVDVEYLQLGASTALSSHALRPYILGAVGIARFSPDAAGASDVTEFSLSVAAGLRAPIREGFELRAEGRGYMTFVSSWSSLFCSSTAAGGTCAVRADGSAFLQFEVLIGVSFLF